MIRENYDNNTHTNSYYYNIAITTTTQVAHNNSSWK